MRGGLICARGSGDFVLDEVAIGAREDALGEACAGSVDAGFHGAGGHD